MSLDLPIALGTQNGRKVLLALAAARGAVAVVAIPLAPVLFEDHLALLVLLRPTKEVFLLAGYEVLEGRQNLLVIVLASLPIMLFGTWLFFLLGRVYRSDLQHADLPGIAGRLLPPKRIRTLRTSLHEHGWTLVFVGRLAIMPSTLVAAAAGSAGVPLRTFLLADTAGAAVSMSAMLGAGYLLGEAYEEAGPWFTALGALALLGLLTAVGRHLSGGGRTRAARARAS